MTDTVTLIIQMKKLRPIKAKIYNQSHVGCKRWSYDSDKALQTQFCVGRNHAYTSKSLI